MKFQEVKRGQVTLFIIIAIVIVGLVVLGVLIYPQVKTTIGLGGTNPALFIQSCIEDKLKETVEKVSLQGGSVEPEHFVLFNGEKVEYLCYTSEDFKLGSVQQPMLKPHIEEEIKENIKDEANDCFDSLKKSYESKGYSVNLKKDENKMKVELLPNRIAATFNYSVTLTKSSTEEYDSFVVVLNNNLYELTAIANSIVEWETTFGNVDTGKYMLYYTDLKVEQNTTAISDGTKVYIITDTSTGNKFQFASRSQVFRAGS